MPEIPDPDEVVTVHAPGVLRRARMRRRSIYGPWQVCKDPQAPVDPPKRTRKPPAQAEAERGSETTTTKSPSPGEEQE